MHLRGNVIYNTWENFWKKAYKNTFPEECCPKTGLFGTADSPENYSF